MFKVCVLKVRAFIIYRSAFVLIYNVGRFLCMPVNPPENNRGFE